MQEMPCKLARQSYKHNLPKHTHLRSNGCFKLSSSDLSVVTSCLSVTGVSSCPYSSDLSVVTSCLSVTGVSSCPYSSDLSVVTSCLSVTGVSSCPVVISVLSRVVSV